MSMMLKSNSVILQNAIRDYFFSQELINRTRKKCYQGVFMTLCVCDTVVCVCVCVCMCIICTHLCALERKRVLKATLQLNPVFQLD